MRTLIAGFGNELRGDDGFGVVVVRRLEEQNAARNGVDLIEIGTGGLRLAQELLQGYDRLIVVDAMCRGGTPGTVYLLHVDEVDAARSIDMHLVIPARAMSVAQALGALPANVIMVGCEPADVDELTFQLSPSVAAAVPLALEKIAELMQHD